MSPRAPLAAPPLGAPWWPRRPTPCVLAPRATAGRGRRGAALAEALVAALVLVVGVLATAGAVAAAVRDGARARAQDAAGEAVAARVARWRAAPCVAGSGDEPAGAGRERWRVRAEGGVGVLADTVAGGAGARAFRVGVVAVAGCGP